jgi:hypothetical protein
MISNKCNTRCHAGAPARRMGSPLSQGDAIIKRCGKHSGKETVTW